LGGNLRLSDDQGVDAADDAKKVFDGRTILADFKIFLHELWANPVEICYEKLEVLSRWQSF
jgi:hypothetical protein